MSVSQPEFSVRHVLYSKALMRCDAHDGHVTNGVWRLRLFGQDAFLKIHHKDRDVPAVGAGAEACLVCNTGKELVGPSLPF